MSEFYLQDTWRATQRLTLDYGVRFLWYEPWYSTQPAAVFVPERYDPAKAPRLYQPARVNGVNVALDPVTGQTLPNVFVGSFVPGTGDRYNGMVSSSDPNYPKGFRDRTGIEPEPRLGLAWDITGNSKTAIHASVGTYHNPHVNANGMDAMARNPPAQNTPSIFYGTMDTLLAAGAQGAFSNRPSGVFGIQRDAPTPVSYNYSVGVQRELGWGTVLDVTYAGFQMRNAEIAKSINSVPDGARFLNIHPENANPQNPTSAKPSEFLRPYVGFQDITIREHYGTGHNNSQLHNLVVSYTWDVPNGSRLWNSWLTRGLLDGWQFSGDTAVVTGDWSGVSNVSTTDNFDFTGGDVAARPNVSGDVVCSTGNCDPTPGAGGSYFNIDAFSRPAGRGDIGNAPVTFFRLPKIVISNMSIFKNFRIGQNKRIQFRWEAYNVFNQVNWSSINTTAQFNAAGQQVNANFGQATGARDPRIMQGAIRFTF
jgi:hypothetical protein